MQPDATVAPGRSAAQRDSSLRGDSITVELSDSAGCMPKGRQQPMWKLAERADPASIERLVEALGVSRLVAELLVNRGLADPADADRFLHPSYDHLPDPLLLPDAEPAVDRIALALQRQERIYVHGDYDGDGVTSAALWTRLLTRLGADVKVHVPHRRDGYDMRSGFVSDARQDGARLIITSDCGVQRCDEVEEAREAGIDVVITDHHEPGQTLPRAVAVVNPHRRDSQYPFRDLAGVGVAFRLGEALVRRLAHSVDSYRRAYGDLAAIGTVTDMMPLLGDNRVFVKRGLEELRQSRKPGLRALIHSAGLAGKPITAGSIGYRIGPRLNAIGRLDDARIALDLLLTQDAEEAASLASRLEQANQSRKVEQDRILAAAMQRIAALDLSEHFCLVLADESWHRGIVGIVASKVVDRLCRPTVLVAIDPETGSGRGSARTIDTFHILDAVTECREFLGDFGGHAGAAGMDVLPGEFLAFAERMNRIALERLCEDDLRPTYSIELDLPANLVTPGLLDDLSLFEPWGRGNPEPLFASCGVRVREVRRMGPAQQHVKLSIQVDGCAAPEALIWNVVDRGLGTEIVPGAVLDICYRPQLNDWNGTSSAQLVVADARPATSAYSG